MFADSGSRLRGTVTHRSLQRVIDHIRSSAWPAKLVCVTGDLIQDDTAAAYTRFCNTMSVLNLPVYCVPGNHDIRALMKTALQRADFHYCENVRLGSWLIAGIDSCKSNSAGGEIGKQELRRLRALLDKSAQQNVLICLHHPPLPVGSKWLDSVGLANAATFLDLVSGYGNVQGAIFGHVHQSFDAVHKGVRIIGTPSTCTQFKAGSDEFAIDDLPPAYRRISLHADGGIEEEIVWLE